MMWRRLGIGLLLMVGACLAQNPPAERSPFDDAPFAEWSKQGAHSDIPWKVHAQSLGLSWHQRMHAQFTITLDGADLVKLGGGGKILCYVQVTDSAGRTFRDNGEFDLDKAGPNLRKQDAWISWDAFVLPGEYHVAVALWHRASGRHDYTETRLEVPALHHDPLPAAWSRLPSVEFWAPIDPSDVEAVFQAAIAGRLTLPVDAARPLRIEILADLTAGDNFGGSRVLYDHYLGAVIPSLKALAEIDAQPGSVAVTALDLRQRHETLRQDPLRELDWKVLKQIAHSPELALVDAHQTGQPSAVFLRDDLEQRLTADANDPARHIYILLSSPLDLYAFPDPDPRMPRCACAVYYVNFSGFGVAGPPRTIYETRRERYGSATYNRMQVVRDQRTLYGVPGKVEHMLAPLPVQSFSVTTPEDFRKALAQILAEAAR